MADVTPIGPSPGPSMERLGIGVTPRDAAGLPFGVGQHVLARVLQMLSPDSALLEIAGQRFTTSTPVPLTPGQILEVGVRGTGTVVDLELLDPPDTISDRAYALASVLEARHGAPAGPRPTLDAIRTLLASLPSAPAGDPAPTAGASLAARAQVVLSPVPLDGDASRLPSALRHAIAASGLFFEARMAGAASAGGQADVAALGDDLRAVLAEIGARGPLPPALEDTRAALAADVLSRQIEVAYHRVKDGELRLDVPVMVGTTPADVHLRVREDRERDGGDETAPGRMVDLTLELPEFGRVRASIGWTPGHVTTHFRVALDSQASVLAPALAALESRLRAVGFRHVAVSVQVEPEALAPPDDSPEPPLPGGSILHVRV